MFSVVGMCLDVVMEITFALITFVAIVAFGSIVIAWAFDIDSAIVYYLTYLSVIALGTVSLIWLANTLV